MSLFDASEGAPVRRISLIKLSSELARSLAAIGRIAVEGEVHKPPSAGRSGGRIWFTLRDRAAQIQVTVPAARARKARVVSGERVLVTGRLEWANQWGSLQLVAEEVVPVGEGAVAAMIAESRARLAADGLLDRRRRPIPLLPRAIGVVCGADAAVRHDIESVVAVKFPGYPVVFREVTVSGSGAAEAIADALIDLDAREEIDVIVLARGGGDLTQLLPFSDEDLCRAIGTASTPVVSAIGHERDRPLCDEVADLRCGTPSLAAGAVVPDRELLHARLATGHDRATAAADRIVERAAARLGRIDRDRAVTAGVTRSRDRLQRCSARLALVSPAKRLVDKRAVLAGHRRNLDALSPQRVLERGYAIVRTASGEVIRDPESVERGERLDVQVAGGHFPVEAAE